MLKRQQKENIIFYTAEAKNKTSKDAGYSEYISIVHDVNFVWLDDYGCKNQAFWVNFEKLMKKKIFFRL